MDRETLRAHEKRILIGLAGFYYEQGYASAAYNDPDTGGIYEHKLADRLGYQLASGDRPPPEFLAAAQLLESQGYVRRMKRQPDFPVMGIWATRAGLDRAEYLKAPWYVKLVYIARDNSTTILVSAITSLIAFLISLFLASIFGLFGLGK